MRKIVVFGLGHFGKQAIEILERNFIENEIIVIDNLNYGYAWKKYNVLQAEKFLREEKVNAYDYIIGGKYSYTTYKQLMRAGIKKEEIFSIQSYIVKYYTADLLKKDCHVGENDNKVVLFDCSGGFVMGGVEQWTYTIGKELKERGYNIKLYTEFLDDKPPAIFKNDIIFFQGDLMQGNDIALELQQFIQLIRLYGNIVCVLSHCRRLAYMAMLLKKIDPKRVRIISVIHSGLEYIALENLLLQNFVDAFLCVNMEVKQWLNNRTIEQGKVYFRITPVLVQELNRTYNTNKTQAIQIGYAARLEVEHKRSDLMMNLMEELEKRECNYQLNIAGDGKCFQVIDDYIRAHQLTHKAKMFGTLEHAEMCNFWRKQDIAVNVSETEGCSLAMLESMACGCVQIITNIPGTELFVENEVNGYRIECGDVETMAEKIKYIEEHRKIISVMGNRSYEKAAEKCDIKKYVDFFEQLITSGEPTE